MSVVEHTTIITPATVRNMKRYKLEDCLLLFANKSVTDEAEIERLKAELELRTKERDQATKNLYTQGNQVIFKSHGSDKHPIGGAFTTPELYAFLDGRGK